MYSQRCTTITTATTATTTPAMMRSSEQALVTMIARVLLVCLVSNTADAFSPGLIERHQVPPFPSSWSHQSPAFTTRPRCGAASPLRFGAGAEDDDLADHVGHMDHAERLRDVDHGVRRSSTLSRRSVLATAAASTCGLLALGSEARAGENYDTATIAISTPPTPPVVDASAIDYDCLRDLPPIPTGHVRLYLCRHGQTENNRLRKVQGARVNPPINDNGMIQATGMGNALARANDVPTKMYHSQLLRARLTAQTAAAQIGAAPPTSELGVLGEIDFGPAAEGQSVALAKAGMEATAARWALGDIDYRPSGGGETGREVLERATKALSFLVEEAKDSNGCIAAVSHSAYLRFLLAMIMDEPLLQASGRKINNGAINVVDVRADGAMIKAGRKPKVIGGRASLAPSDFDLEYPDCSVVRINENRHLAVL